MKRKISIAVFLLAIMILGAACTPTATGTGTPQTRATEADRVQDTPEPTNTEIPFTQVVTAIQDIPRGVQITPDMVTVIRFPLESAPTGAITDLEDAVGLIAATTIYREEILIARKLVEDLNALGETGSDAAAVLEPGRVAIAVPMDRITSVAYALQPGDRVDVIVSMLFVDIDQDLQTLLPNQQRILSFTTNEGGFTIAWGAPYYGELETQGLNIPYVIINEETGSATTSTLSSTFNIVTESNPLDDGGRPRPRLVTQRTVTDAQVVWVGEFPEDGRIFAPAASPTPIATPTDPADATGDEEGEGEPVNTPIPPRPTIITLAVSPQDAVTLTYMAEAGIPMTFALRSARTQGLPDTNPVNLSYILANYNIVVPDRLSFSLEPAIRSIRGITLSDITDASTEEAATEEEGGN